MIERSVNGKACGQSNSNKLENKELKRGQIKCKSQDKDKKKKLKTKGRTRDLFRRKSQLCHSFTKSEYLHC